MSFLWYLAFFVSLLIIAIIAKQTIFNNSKDTHKDGVLLLGLCNSGKTSLFHVLLDDTYTACVTSITHGVGVYTNKHTQNVKIYDFNGHGSGADSFQYLGVAQAIVLMLDASEFYDNYRDVAELLYRVVTDKHMQSGAVPILILCNKQDLRDAQSANSIKKSLLREIDELRTTRAAAPRLVDEEDDFGQDEEILLGVDGEALTWDDIVAPVEFAESSAANRQIDDVEQFLQQFQK